MNSITKSDRPIESSRMLLDAVYKELGYQDGELLNTSLLPSPKTQNVAWLEKGDWLSIAASVGAEKILFVNNDPVFIFCEAPDNHKQTLLNIFRQAWCMGRPQCLFVASPGELKVFSLNQHPVQNTDDWNEVRPLENVIRETVEVSEILQAYRREQVESGQLFIEKNFGKLEHRADKQLILDLKVVRKFLLEIRPETNQRYIHALIGRSIFVRYLEDRHVLEPEYFQKVAQDISHPGWSPNWLNIVNTPDTTDLTPDNHKQTLLNISPLKSSAS